MFSDALKMQVFRWVFYLMFFLFNSMIFGFTSYLFGKYPNLLSDYRIVHYLSGLGIILFFIGFGFEMIRHKKFKRILARLEKENIEVKFKLSKMKKPRHHDELLTEARDGSGT